MILKCFVCKLIEYKIISEDDRELYLYGLQLGVVTIQNVLITIILGVLFQNLISTIAFLIAYIPLRSYAGGYHATSSKICFIYSLGLIFLIEIYFTHSLGVRDTVLLLGGAIYIIYKYAPLQSENKSLSYEETIRYADIVKKVLCLEVSVLIFFWIINVWSVVCGVSVAIIVVSILLIVGIILKSVKNLDS